ncbi:Coiled-coil domain-containing protein 25 [Thoreauomyces humboldtii]|nr:Coiled-coil domain-containing protein 25 [Thoreauomyces humboldtii]
MVFYFTSNVVSPSAKVYMGKDKYENEELIKYGWPEDVWFHVDKLSSAHVYLRLEPGQSWDSIDEGLLTDLAQLTKANSIEGNKKSNLTIIYTPWSNLKKTQGMETGQVTFFRNDMVKRVHVKERDNGIVNRLNKTKIERHPELAEEKVERDRELRTVQREADRKRRQAELRTQEERKKEVASRSYSNIFKEEEMRSNKDSILGRSNLDINALEEDFM